MKKFSARLFGLFSLVWCLVFAIEVCGSSVAARARADKDELPANASYLSPGGEVTMSWEWLTLPEERIMALTFDDGPVERDTEIAALLKNKEAVGTFFFIGYKVENNHEIVKKVAAASNEIGYHSYRHQKLNWVSQADLKEDFRLGKEAFAELGIPLSWFRPPYGLFNSKVVKTAKDEGMETILWTVDPKDWTGVGPDVIAKRVIRQFHPGAVLLFHSNHAATLQALPEIIDAAKSQGYRLVALSEWRRTVQTAHCRKNKHYCPPTMTDTVVASNPEIPLKLEVSDNTPTSSDSLVPDPTAVKLEVGDAVAAAIAVIADSAPAKPVRLVSSKRCRHRTPMPVLTPPEHPDQLTRSSPLPFL